MISNRRLFQNFLAQTSTNPLMIEIKRAEGVYLYGPKKEKYLDLIAGIAVSNLGHQHPKVTEAIKKQVDQYAHVMVYGELIQSPQVKLAEAMISTLPEHLDNIYFVNSGSEAVEGALKLAKRYTGRSQIIACKQAYHGSTHGALSVTGDEALKQNFRPLLPGIKFIRFANESDLEFISHKTAAIIIETVQGEAGVQLANSKYFTALQKKCKNVGALLIVDEIQTGFGRTGKFWAFEHYNFTPDILLSAKGMGGGMPIGAFIAPQKIMSKLTQNPVLGHITTFGGHPVSAAAALANIQVLLQENYIANVEKKAKLFIKLLKHSKIVSIRNKGLMMALEFESFDLVQSIIHFALKLGLITDWFLFCDNAIRIAPPLTITEAQITEACNILLESIELGTKNKH